MEETVLLDVQRIQTSEQSSIILHSVRAVDLVNHRYLSYTSSIATASHTTSKTVVNCLYAGQQLARERRVVLPLLPESLYLLGGMVIAAEDHREKEVITHNRLCEEAEAAERRGGMGEYRHYKKCCSACLPPAGERAAHPRRLFITGSAAYPCRRSEWLGAGPAQRILWAGRVRNGRHRFANRFRSGIGRERDDVSVIA